MRFQVFQNYFHMFITSPDIHTQQFFIARIHDQLEQSMCVADNLSARCP